MRGIALKTDWHAFPGPEAAPPTLPLFLLFLFSRSLPRRRPPLFLALTPGFSLFTIKFPDFFASFQFLFFFFFLLVFTSSGYSLLCISLPIGLFL